MLFNALWSIDVAVVVVVLNMLLAMLKRLFNSSAFSHPMALYHVFFPLLCYIKAHTPPKCVNVFVCLLFSNRIFTNAIHADRMT